ncbi:uncharacterized protein SCHCODRAFT_02624850 [Schizophyllum commune H4-8]|uniref:uncharacterized protein n=1 Tax=Schizophyllum commune (strain H4-8 / FGSC 9210) TaxID=578458 RepID=UPI002160C72B|nr:uncharacterized protein SCHCODRAFT_02624850 [Schizophyllum commune H4-8]KAI5891956.1 hypothetical protein SCHCODRAFT_02624850 [Schizophyllum commune H4-8]
MLPFDSIAVLALTAEMFFLGLYTVLWVRHVMVMVGKGFSSRKHSIFLALSTTMYVSAVLHAGLLAYRVLYGLGLTPEAAERQHWWTDLTGWHIRMISALQFTQVVIGDLIQAFRTYVAWSFNLWVVILPFPFFLTGVVTTILSFIPAHPTPYLQLLLRIGLPSSLTYNLTMSALLIWRLTRAHAESARAGVRDATRPPVLLRIARVVAETGALYVCAYAIFIALDFAGRLEMFVVQAALMPIGGMTFSLMSIRLYGIVDEEPESSWSWPSWTTWSKTETFPGDSDGPYPPDVERAISRHRDRTFSGDRERRLSGAGELSYSGHGERILTGDCERTLSGEQARTLSLERAHTHGSSQSTLQRTSQHTLPRTLQSTLSPDAVVQR